MFAQGYLAALLPPSANPFGFSTIGQQENWGGFGNRGQVNPMGWWNSEGKGQPGILGGLLKVGKYTFNGILRDSYRDLTDAVEALTKF